MLIIREVVSETYTNASGYALLLAMKAELKGNSSIQVSFEGIKVISSSFFNSSFGEMIIEFGLEEFSKKIKPVNLNKTNAELIRNFFKSYKKKYAAA